VYVAKEAIYEDDEQGQPYRLVAAAGSEISEEQMEAAGLKASDKRLVKVADDEYHDWLQENDYISESQVPNPGA
jgi:hypothetical protein